jgi:hypothetical protein
MSKNTVPQSPAMLAAGAAIRLPRYLSWEYTDEDVARLAIDAYGQHIQVARAAKPRRPRRRTSPTRKRSV